MRLRPRGQQAAIHVADRGGAQQPPQLVDALAGQPLIRHAGNEGRRESVESIPRRRRHAGEAGGHEVAHGPRHAAHAGQHAGAVEVAVVPGEQLIPAVAGQRDGDVPAGQLRHEERGQLRGIRVRLVERLRQAWNQRACVVGRQQQLRVIGPQEVRDPRRVGRLVELLLGEADRVRVHRPRAGLLHQRDHGRGVDATRQEGPERNVCAHPATDRVRQQRVERVDRVAVGAGKGCGEAVERDVAQRPVGARRRQRALRIGHREHVPGRNLDRALEDAPRGRDVQVPQV